MELGTKPTVVEGNYYFLFLTILTMSLGGIFQQRELYSGLLITQYLLIALPVLLFLKTKKYSIKENLRLNKTSFKNIILSIIITIFTYPIAIFFNMITISIIEKYGALIESPIKNPGNMEQFLIGFIVIALTPGICEEIVFRGFFLSAYEKLGKNKTIIYSSILFGIFHYNFQNLLGPIVLGIVFSIMVYKTNSIIVSMVGHTLNNTIALLLGYFLTKLQPADGTIIVESQQLIGEPNMVFIILFFGIMAFCSGVIIFVLIKQMDSGEVQVKENVIEFNQGNKLYIKEVEKVNFVMVLPIIISLLIYIGFSYLNFFSTLALS